MKLPLYPSKGMWFSHFSCPFWCCLPIFLFACLASPAIFLWTFIAAFPGINTKVGPGPDVFPSGGEHNHRVQISVFGEPYLAIRRLSFKESAFVCCVWWYCYFIIVQHPLGTALQLNLPHVINGNPSQAQLGEKWSGIVTCSVGSDKMFVIGSWSRLSSRKAMLAVK